MTKPKYEFQKGDYIKFQRIVHGAREATFETHHATGQAILQPAIPEQILAQSGSGQILSIAKSPKRVARMRKNKRGISERVVDKVNTARVAAGAGLGTVTAILDDAVLDGKQGGLFDMLAVDTDTHNMYGTDGRLA